MNGTEKQNETSMEMPAEDSRVTMGNTPSKNELPTLLLRPWQLPCLSSA